MAREAVNRAPSEFVTWEKLTELYIDVGDYENALLTLNSCPMFTFNGRDAHRNLTPSKVSLPFIKQIGEILPPRVKTEEDEADPALTRLPAPGLKGTWARAYGLLTRLVSLIGWDELLRTRSVVFVMEEEYRMQKVRTEVKGHEEGKSGEHEEDDDASTRGIPPSASVIHVEEEEEDPEGTPPQSAIPSIRISSPEPIPLQEEDKGKGKEEPPSPSEPFSFSNKRLCERWLDNLFMVLYEVSPRSGSLSNYPIDAFVGSPSMDNLPR